MTTLLRNISQIVNVTRNQQLPYMVDGYDMFCVTGEPDSFDKYAIILDRESVDLLTLNAGALNVEMEESAAGSNHTSELTRMCLESVLYKSCLARFRRKIPYEHQPRLVPFGALGQRVENGGARRGQVDGLAASLKARAISHLDDITPAGVVALKTSQTAAIILPITSLLRRGQLPPAVSIAQAGVPIVLGTNFNSGQYCSSMPIVMYLACTTLGLTLDQALMAATLNAAYSLKLSHKVGAITEGRQGDFVVINSPT
ncbi:unnamed protein product [Schistocephalus solidus]|uniref:Probable imidazolonepropionase n=1 Tax=Schistocephalus solidus TaxID=70667 RepID=A0A183S719_SCHSO|nr:unnamed protein product [Schistocephalus solidus]